MKKIIVVWVVLLGVVLSGCEKSPNESTKISAPSSEQKTKTTETSAQSSEQNTKTAETTSQSSEQKSKSAVKTSQPKSSTSSEVSQASDTIRGVWMATGKQDGVSSNWYFNNGQLTVNYVYHFSYVIAKNKD